MSETSGTLERTSLGDAEFRCLKVRASCRLVMATVKAVLGGAYRDGNLQQVANDLGWMTHE